MTDPLIDAATEHQVRLAFTQLTFDWQEYGNLRAHASTYQAGHADFFR